MAPAKTITLTVTRFDPGQDDEPRPQSYEVPFQDDMVVLDALNWIKTHADGSVSYRWSCRMGICGSCGMNVNGGPKLGCSAFLRAYLPGPGAIWDCSFIGECSAVGPKGVDPAKAIQQTKFESSLGMMMPWGGK